MPSDDIPKHQRHSPTSIAAAESVSVLAAAMRAKVYSYLYRCGAHGATDEELQIALDMGGSTERPRRIELCEAQMVRDSGIQRHTKSGRRAVVWIVTRKEIDTPTA
jgi:hypothetical protein